MNNVTQIMAAVKNQRASWRLMKKLGQMTPQTTTDEALAKLDDETDLDELLRLLLVHVQEDVAAARSRHVRACNVAFEAYQSQFDQAFDHANRVPPVEEDLILIAVRRSNLTLLRGDYAHLRPIAEAIMDDQHRAKVAWLKTVGESYRQYAHVAAVVLVKLGEVQHVA